MVSLWPWKGSGTSPAEFEKTLSTLSAKIARATTRLDGYRQRSRRYRVLWTLYTSFAYLLYSIIVTLVLGWQNWGPCEYSTVAGGPVLIYVVRLGLDKYYQYRISGTHSHLDELHKQRDATIEKLKEATRYNSTQQLLEKYGGDSPKRPETQQGTASGVEGPVASKKRDPRMRASLPLPAAGGRTGIPPPPTANIPRMQPGSVPTTPIRSPPMHDQRRILRPSNLNPNTNQPGQLAQGNSPSVDEPGFAPNAFPPSQPQQLHASQLQPHWYDRILDVLLGEDETLAKNRLALICTQCRLVNGQAAPGVRSLEEIGRWRCGSCGALNGEESETTKALTGIQEAAAASASATVTTTHRSRSSEDNAGACGGQAARSWDRNKSDHARLIHEVSQASRPGSRGGENGAWDPVSGQRSLIGEMGSGNSSVGKGMDAGVSTLVDSTSSEGEEYYDDDEDIEDSDEVEVEVKEAHDGDQATGGGGKGAHKRRSGSNKKMFGNAGLHPSSAAESGNGISTRTRSKSPRITPEA
ncbi:DUF2296 and TFIIa superfamily domain-containing protein [Histoplasma capsulatum]|uniref:Endoplasmic reticulum junction formation protein lunapark n=1 Tax=Ajellomyces capsulatus TaxID=5037 RepID=A0A8A1MLJ5_AJECA|nr:conserved hypothetical protein [Histoplasma mississippiense (nom. inval.)]EDN11046.1 conserved hypothetical protein [Histoplasma mississippiense (nom. inval.)]QSS67021.1 DUF2296 and TFIIa superfamily domain-containing protein [Histoplasma capsulatum]